MRVRARAHSVSRGGLQVVAVVIVAVIIVVVIAAVVVIAIVKFLVGCRHRQSQACSQQGF